MLIGIGLAIIILQFIQPTVVSGDSMYPYLKDGDFLIMNKINKEPDYEDVAVFLEENRLLIKRTIGKPGDTISFKDGMVYRNNNPLEEEYIDVNTEEGETVTLKSNEYYFMGDNRSNSLDSRMLGPINKNQIKGIAAIRLFPRISIL